MGLKEDLEAARKLARAMGELVAESGAEVTKCKFCGSPAVVKNGHRKGTQYLLCTQCGKGFVNNKALPKMRYPIDVVAKGVYDYYAGVSLNKIRNGIDAQWKVQPADSAVYGWVKLLTDKAMQEVKKHPLNVGDRWVADETVVTLSGKKYWALDIIDSDTRYLLGFRLSSNRSIKDIKAMLETAKEKAGKSPQEIVTDGWSAYPDSIEQVFGADTTHVRGAPFKSGDENSNLIERWHGTLKDRLKPMRGMDKSNITQLVLDGFVLYYNYFRPHESLGERTPAEAAGVRLPYRSWFDVARSLQPEPELLLKDRNGVRVAYRVRNKHSDKRAGDVRLRSTLGAV